MIVGTQGNQGNGKTALLTWLARHYHEQGYRIYANYWIQIPGLEVNYITTISQLEKIHDGMIFLDEFWIWIDSRVSGFSDINAAVTGILMNLRKRRCSLFYESKRMHFSDRRIRELTDYVLEPHIYYNNNGSLERIEQDMLYPIDLSSHLDRLWVVTKKYRIISESRMQEVDDENDIIFRLEDIVHLYNTSEEICSLAKMERFPGLQTGIIKENNLEDYIKARRPEDRIARNNGSRGWDLCTSALCISVTSITPPREHGKQFSIPTREKRIKELLADAIKHNKFPIWAWNYKGEWFYRKVRLADAGVTQIPAVGKRFAELLAKT